MKEQQAPGEPPRKSARLQAKHLWSCQFTAPEPTTPSKHAWKQNAKPKKLKTLTELSPLDGINLLPDVLLIKIFQHLSCKQTCTSVARVCKRWNKLSKDLALWRTVDLRGCRSKLSELWRAIRMYCSGTTVSVLLARQKCNTARLRRRSKAQSNKCLSTALVKEIAKRCPRLKHFTIEQEQLGKVDLFKKLPSSIETIALRHCDITESFVIDLCSPDMRLSKLCSLDLTGVKLHGFRWPNNQLTFPRTLQTLVLRNSSLYFTDREMENVLVSLVGLTTLDVSLMKWSLPTLKSLSRKLTALRVLSLVGCLISNPLDDELDDEEAYTDWTALWRDGFHDITRLNVRNSYFLDESPCPIVRDLLLGHDIPHLIDVDGFIKGAWDISDSVVSYEERNRPMPRLHSWVFDALGRRAWWDDSDSSDDTSLYDSELEDVYMNELHSGSEDEEVYYGARGRHNDCRLM